MSETRQFKLTVYMRYHDGHTNINEHMLLTTGTPAPQHNNGFIQWYTPDLHISYSAQYVENWTIEEEVPEP